MVIERVQPQYMQDPPLELIYYEVQVEEGETWFCSYLNDGDSWRIATTSQSGYTTVFKAKQLPDFLLLPTEGEVDDAFGNASDPRRLVRIAVILASLEEEEWLKHSGGSIWNTKSVKGGNLHD